jgi:hypothetical protein
VNEKVVVQTVLRQYLVVAAQYLSKHRCVPQTIYEQVIRPKRNIASDIICEKALLYPSPPCLLLACRNRICYPYRK